MIRILFQHYFIRRFVQSCMNKFYILVQFNIFSDVAIIQLIILIKEANNKPFVVVSKKVTQLTFLSFDCLSKTNPPIIG